MNFSLAEWQEWFDMEKWTPMEAARLTLCGDNPCRCLSSCIKKERESSSDPDAFEPECGDMETWGEMSRMCDALSRHLDGKELLIAPGDFLRWLDTKETLYKRGTMVTEYLEYIRRQESKRTLLEVESHIDVLTEAVSQQPSAGQESPSASEELAEIVPPPDSEPGLAQFPTDIDAHIKAWNDVLPKLRGAELAAARFAIEKWRGKSHPEAYLAVSPGGSASDPKAYVSRKRAVAQTVSDKYGLTMPNWTSGL